MLTIYKFVGARVRLDYKCISNTLLFIEHKIFLCAHALTKSGRGLKLKAALMRCVMRALSLPIVACTEGCLDLKVPEFRAAQSSLRVSLMRNKQSALERVLCWPGGRP